MEQINRQAVMENLILLIKNKNLKIGEVQKELGVSIGYISRLVKKENRAALSAQFLWRAARYFNVTMDYLVRDDIGKQDKNIGYLREFLNYLIQQTNSGKLEWKAIRINEINRNLSGEPCCDFPVGYYEGLKDEIGQIFNRQELIQDGGGMSQLGQNKLITCIQGDMSVKLMGTVYSVSHANKQGVSQELFLTHYGVNTVSGCTDFYEIMLLDREEYQEYLDSQRRFEQRLALCANKVPWFIDEVCNTFETSWNPIKTEIQELYSVVSLHENDIRISENVRNFIDGFIFDSKGNCKE